MKKIVAILLCAAMLLGLGTVGVAEEQISFTWLHHFQEEGLKNWCQTMADKFMEDNPNVTITIEIVNSDVYQQVLKTKIAADDAPMIFDLDNNTILREYVNAGHLTELTDLPFLANVNEDNLREATIDGNVWGVTFSTCALAEHYNKALFDKYDLSVPKTRSAYMELCETLIEKGIQPIAAGYGETWCIMRAFQGYLFPLCWMNDADWQLDLVNRTTRFADDENFKKAFTMFIETKPFWGRDPFGTTWDAAQNMVANGDAAMMHNGSWAIEGIGGRNDECEVRVFSTPLTEDPADVTMLMRPGSILCVYNSADEAKHDAAMAFMATLQTLESGTTFSQGAIQMSTVKGIDFSFSPALNDILTSEKVFNYAGLAQWNNEYNSLFFEVIAKYVMEDDPDVEQLCVELDQLFDSLV